MTVESGVRGLVRDRALDLHIVPSIEVPTYTSQRYVPWINWTQLPNTSEGVQDFLGSFYSYGTTTFQVVNNTDSILYITGGIPERNSLISGPEVIIGPFRGSNITLSSSSVTILSRCYGYDFTTARSIRGFLDTRGPSAYIDIKGLKQNDNPPLPTLRSSWQRFYDLFDLTLNDALPSPHTTNRAWGSNIMDLSGAQSCYLNLVCTATAIPDVGHVLLAFMSYNGIATGQGNFSAGGSAVVQQIGTNYLLNIPIILSANKPILELNYQPGDTSGNQVTYIDMWISAEVTA